MARADINAPVFPPAPKEWNKKWGDEIVFLLRLVLNQMLTPGPEKVNALQILDVIRDPADITNFAKGVVYSQSGNLKITT